MPDYKVSITVVGEDDASGPLGRVSDSLSGLGNIAGGILTADFIKEIGRQIMELGGEAIQSYSDFERLGFTLNALLARESMGKDATLSMKDALTQTSGATQDLIKWVQDLAIHSPFKQSDIAQTLQMGMSFGFTSDQAKRLTGDLVDYAAATGRTGDVVSRMVYALGEMKTQGRLTSLQMRELALAGLPVKQILAEGLGVTTDKLEEMIQKGLIPADKAFDILSQSIEKDFGGAAGRQAGTFSGLLTSLQDLKEIDLRTFFAGTFQAAQPYIQKVVDLLGDPVFTAGLTNIGGALGQMVGVGLSGISNFISVLGELKNSPILNALQFSFSKIFGVLTDPAMVGAVQSVLNTLLPILEKLGQSIATFVLATLNKVGVWFAANRPLIDSFAQRLAAAINTLLPVILVLWNTAAPLLSGLVDLLLGIVKIFMQTATGDWKGAWATLQSVAENAGSAIWTAILNFIDGIARMMGSSLGEIKTTWANDWNLFVSILQNIGPALWAVITNWFGGIVSTIQNKISEVTSTWQNNWNLLQQIVSNVLAVIHNAIRQKLVDGIQTTISNVPGIIGNVFSQIIGVVAPVLTNLGTSITGKFNEIKSTLRDLIGDFISIGEDVISGILTGLENNAGSLIDYLTGVIEDLIKQIESMLGIASPSKVFAGIGKNMMLGLAHGITTSIGVPRGMLAGALNDFIGMGRNAASVQNNNSITDNSQKYYAPINNNYIVQQLQPAIRVRA
jgi:tape measure domain-containing protein